MHVPWEDVQLFLAIAEARSLTGASKRLRITQPTASRRLLELESLLGERLFDRSVEGVVITSFGERMLEPARRMAEWAGEVDRTAARAETALTGPVRITAPPGIAFEFLAPFAATLREHLPAVRLEVISSVAYLDLARREADLALRLGSGSRDLVTLASLEQHVAAFGSKAYAATLPKHPSIADVAWIGWAPPLDHLAPNPELAKRIPGFRPVFASDDFLVQLRAAEAGIGAVFLARERHSFSTSALVPLPVDVGHFTRQLHLVCAKSALDVPRIRAVAERLADALRFVEDAETQRKHPRAAKTRREKRPPG